MLFRDKFSILLMAMTTSLCVSISGCRSVEKGGREDPLVSIGWDYPHLESKEPVIEIRQESPMLEGANVIKLFGDGRVAKVEYGVARTLHCTRSTIERTLREIATSGVLKFEELKLRAEVEKREQQRKSDALSKQGYQAVPDPKITTAIVDGSTTTLTIRTPTFTKVLSVIDHETWAQKYPDILELQTIQRCVALVKMLGHREQQNNE